MPRETKLTRRRTFVKPSKTTRAASEQKKAVPLNNAFEALDVEDTKDETEDDLNKLEWSKPKEAATVTVLEDEDEATHIKIDKALRVLTLLEDVQVRVRASYLVLAHWDVS